MIFFSVPSLAKNESAEVDRYITSLSSTKKKKMITKLRAHLTVQARGGSVVERRGQGRKRRKPTSLPPPKYMRDNNFTWEAWTIVPSNGCSPRSTRSGSQLAPGSSEKTGDGVILSPPPEPVALPGVSSRCTEGGQGSRRMAGHQTENSSVPSSVETEGKRGTEESERGGGVLMFCVHGVGGGGTRVGRRCVMEGG